jgi:hypothetical protein
MNASEVNTLGGVCELLGLASVVWGLVDLARYRGVPARIRAWLNARRVAVVAAVRKLLRRPSRSAVVHAQAASATATAFGATAVTMRGPFTPQPGQSLEGQIAELGALVNRLREELLTQGREHRQAIDTMRKQMDEKLQAERNRADAALNGVRAELERLREATTGGLRLQTDGVLAVLVGVFLTTWPDAVAGWLPSWPSFPVALLLIVGYALLRVLFAYVRWYDARPAAQPSAGQTPLRRSA